MEKVICRNCGSDNGTNSKYCKDCGYELPKVDFVAADNSATEGNNIKRPGKKTILGTVVGVIAFFISFYGVQHFFFDSSIDKDMMAVASEMNKSYPMMVDSETRLDHTIALPDKVFQYNYTLVNMDKSEVDTISMKNYLEPNIINLIKSSPQMKFQRDNRWTLNYCYKDKNGVYLFMVSVTPEKYEEK